MAQTPPCRESDLPGDETFLAGETPLLVGQFRFTYDDEQWEWSPEAAQLHGYPAEAMRPTTALVLSHKHPDDHTRLAAALEHVRRTRAPISTRHRIVDVQGRTHEVVVVGQRLLDDAGEVIGSQGFYIDVTAQEEETRQRDHEVTEAVAEIAERRSVIEEVKGMLMLIYRIDDETAFALLRWRSQNTNTKLRPLAEQLRDDFTALDYGEQLPPRSAFDSLLLTAHDRVQSA
jgi:PAS domain S-box-containing protein